MCVVLILVMYVYTFWINKKDESFQKTGKEALQIMHENTITKAAYTVFPMEKAQNLYSTLELPKQVNWENLRVENDYLNHCLYLSVPNTESDFYEKTVTFQAQPIIRGIYHYYSDGQDNFLISLNGVYECTYYVEDQVLYLQLENISQVYEHIAVIDFILQSEDDSEKEVLQDEQIFYEYCKAISLDTKSKIICIDRNRNMLSEEEIVDFLQECDADLYLAFLVQEQEDVKKMAGYYQTRFYQNGLDSVTLSDMLLRNVAAKIGSEVDGLFPMTECQDPYEDYGVVSAKLYLGSTDYKKKKEDTSGDLFYEKCVEGLKDTLTEAFAQSDSK